VEDSGVWNVFIDGAVIPNLTNLTSLYLQTSQTLIPYMSDIVKPSYKVWALYIQNHGLSIGFVIYFGWKLPNIQEKFQ